MYLAQLCTVYQQGTFKGIKLSDSIVTSGAPGYGAADGIVPGCFSI